MIKMRAKRPVLLSVRETKITKNEVFFLAASKS